MDGNFTFKLKRNFVAEQCCLQICEALAGQADFFKNYYYYFKYVSIIITSITVYYL